MNAILVEKEQIVGNLVFPKEDVLTDKTAQQARYDALLSAARLGNGY